MGDWTSAGCLRRCRRPSGRRSPSLFGARSCAVQRSRASSFPAGHSLVPSFGAGRLRWRQRLSEPSSKSPGSIRFRSRLAWWPQTPAKQSACSSIRTDKAFPSRSRGLALEARHLLCNAHQILHVMAHLMGDHIGLRKFAGRAKSLRHYVEEGQVEVDFVIAGAIEGTDG